MLPRVIAIDDDEMFLTAIKTLFSEKQIPLATFTDPEKAMNAIEQAKTEGTPFRMAIVDFDLSTRPARGDSLPLSCSTGDEVVRTIKSIDPRMHTVILSACVSQKEAALCTSAGADHIYQKQKSKEVILLIAEVASLKIKHGKLADEEKEANSEWIQKILNLRGCSAALANVANEVYRYAATSENVLITGQSGVGKEQVACAIHTNSPRKANRFIAINCGAIPKDLVESELFGHTKGSFSGADRNREGKFAAANSGTIFLDEIGEMPLDLQVKLLRTLQEKEVVPVGSNTPIKIDVRVVAATNRSLQDEVRKERFREDLYYRLNILPINVPSLSERRDDIEPITRFIVEHKNQETGLQKHITDDAIEVLKSRAWSGNVRELSGAIRKAYTLADEVIDRFSFADLLAKDDVSLSINNIEKPDEFPTYREFIEKNRDHLERVYFEKAMVLADGKRAEAARLVDLPYTTYIRKRRNLGLVSDLSA